MDKSKTYIKMCEKAYEINELKWDYGFTPGDWIYLGEDGVKVIASDIFGIRQTVGVSDVNNDGDEKKFAVIELAHTDNISFDVDGNLDKKTIDVHISKYPVDSFVNPVWLPRQDQLESFYYQAVLNDINVFIWIELIAEYSRNFEFKKFKTMEQMSLAIIMNVKYDKEWNGEDWV